MKRVGIAESGCELSEVSVVCADALSCYETWQSPVVIISDGPYGISGYDGDLRSHEQLVEFYRPHITAWSRYSSAVTTLWLWNTEVGWAELHPLLREHGWLYRSCNIWNKGIAHVAGNTNTKTLRRFPVVTEVCAHYVRRPEFFTQTSCELTAQEWMRSEWKRTGLPWKRANDACGVRNAATRKYLTADHVWYFPPPEVFEKLAAYANMHGAVEGRPYFSLNGLDVITASQWTVMRGKFACPAGVTNVWNVPALRGKERIKVDGAVVHPNQKPLRLMEMLIEVSSEVGDVIWEPFGGLCTGMVAAHTLGRRGFAAEINPTTFTCAHDRLVNIK